MGRIKEFIDKGRRNKLLLGILMMFFIGFMIYMTIIAGWR